jgi:hypothetical protein
VRFLTTSGPGGAKDLVDDRVQHGVEPRPGLRGAFADQRPGTVGVGEPAQPPARMQPPVGGLRIPVSGGADAGALLTKLGQ